MTNNIPAHAKKAYFSGGHGKSGWYHWWQIDGIRDFWAWAALGNSALATSEEEARIAARKWIRDGVERQRKEKLR
jgi:hypothetical protein